MPPGIRPLVSLPPLRCLPLLLAALFCAALLTAPRARADAVDLAVDAFAAGGAAIGVPITPAETAIIKPLVRCVAVQGQNILECAKETVIAQLPEETRGVVRCITGGKSPDKCAEEEVFKHLPAESRELASCIANGNNVAQCGTKFATDQAISQLPAETQALARCVQGGGNPAECTKQEVIKRLPAQSQELAKCVAGGANVANCGKDFAVTQAEKAAFETVEKLKIGEKSAEDRLGKGATTGIQNIINVVDGIMREDWQKVLENGGKAVAKYVVKTVISSLLTSATTAVVGPIVDTIIENRFDLVKDLVRAIQAGDWAQLPRILGEAYLTSYVEVACALIPDGAVKTAICGTLGKIIGAVGGFVGDIAGKIVGIIKDILGGLGDLLDGIGKGIAGKDDNCGTPQNYYASSMLICYNRGAYLKISDPGGYQAFVAGVYDRCRKNFIRCEYSDTVTKICNPMRDLLNQHVDQLAAALNESANAYARSRKSSMDAQKSRICSPQFADGEVNNFLNGCEGRLKQNYPLQGDALSADCRPDPKRCNGLLVCDKATAQLAACKGAVDNGDWKRTTAEICKGAGKCFPLEAAPKDELIVR